MTKAVALTCAFKIQCIQFIHGHVAFDVCDSICICHTVFIC